MNTISWKIDHDPTATRLDLSHCHLPWNDLTYQPLIFNRISRLTNLTCINISGNNLRSIPDVITQLPHLTILLVNDNRITTIPYQITNLINLTQLDISSNRIITIPECLTELTSLKEIYLDRNPLITFPWVLTRLPHLITIDIDTKVLVTIDDLRVVLRWGYLQCRLETVMEQWVNVRTQKRSEQSSWWDSPWLC
jgi:internalin A